MPQTFTVLSDPDYGFIVADASVAAKSFAMVPALARFCFRVKAEAVAHAAALTDQMKNNWGEIPLRMIETPDRFEAVADTLYGPAWE
jgi:hypothetical protein